MVSRLFRALRKWVSEQTLSAKLIAITSGLLVVGLLVSAVVSLTLLQRDLTERVDRELHTNVQSVIASVTDLAGNTQSVLPSRYFVAIAGQTGTIAFQLSSLEKEAQPRLPELTMKSLEQHDEPFTVSSNDGSARWRVLLVGVRVQGSGLTVAAVALPLADVDSTLQRVRMLLLSTGIIVVTIGSILGLIAIRRSLRHLRDVEATAQAIAAGNLSQRVPELPVTTEVGRVSAALNMMLSQIESSFAVKDAAQRRMRRFVADASHELRTPLASIRGYGELYRIGAVPPKDVEPTMRRIEDEAIRMGTLVEDLLVLARLDDQRPMARKEVDLRVLANDALFDGRALAPDRTMRILVEDPRNEGFNVVGDEGQLRQVFTNLVGNAARHTPSGVPVEIVLKRPDAETVAFCVRDHGQGIPEEQRDRIFERFYRTDLSRNRRTGGSGLGLSIVAAIIDAHHGIIVISETEGGGASFDVFLPTGTPAPSSDTGDELTPHAEAGENTVSNDVRELAGQDDAGESMVPKNWGELAGPKDAEKSEGPTNAGESAVPKNLGEQPALGNTGASMTPDNANKPDSSESGTEESTDSE